MKALCVVIAVLLCAAPMDAVAKKRRTAKKSSVRRAAPKKGRVIAKRKPAAPAVAPAVRAAAQEEVQQTSQSTKSGTIENPAALVPFFEQLFRVEQGLSSNLHILHFGDSHTASDDWAHMMRTQFQEKFGNGGPGFSLAGRPYNSYRRFDVKSGGTGDWYTDGLVGRAGDGRYGLGGISITTSSPGQTVYLQAEGEQVELFYLRQPEGGELQFFDNGRLVDRVTTKGELGAGYYRYLPTESGPHRYELQTIDRAPVRLFGWVTENHKGITYETLGINGAQAPMQLNWDPDILASNMSRRNPALVLLAYGTNEANKRDWTPDEYRVEFARVLERLRASAPAATILVIGPPDGYYRVRGKSGWLTLQHLDQVTAVQREVAKKMGCAFYDLRQRMGGPGSLPKWIAAGLGQYDHVHLTGEGYRTVARVLYQDLMDQYRLYSDIRKSWPEKQANGQPSENLSHP